MYIFEHGEYQFISFKNVILELHCWYRIPKEGTSSHITIVLSSVDKTWAETV